MVEWVEKTSFDCLNKLFKITAIKRHHQTLLSARNLLVVVREPQPYVHNILPRLLSKVVVPRGHFVLKDLPFYAKARQEHFDQREEKRHEGTLRKAPDEKGCGSSPAVRPPTTNKKKKTLSQAIKIVSLTPKPSSSSIASASGQSGGSTLASEGNSHSPRLDTVNPGIGLSQNEPELLA